MDVRRASIGLGLFSIVLGVAEIAATRRIARALGNDHRAGRVTLRAFGAREMLAGAGILAAPAHSTLVWNRVAGDAMDLAALGLAARNAPRHRAIWGAIAFVASATIIDALVARALDKKTGRAFPARHSTRSRRDGAGQDAKAQHDHHPTTIEPEDMPFVQAPEVTRH
ncbi:hypothetical protein BV98_003843 [Sphingobium herbicidovorans NBRC 16415]|uniref:Cyclase dehydrase n=1 Tax=Sphingobium herbicidovorans (strain ATCC 700291 / DSM 11019 / CCUG 56400 / KCTC 2939 / LMG 18315 / NBRC 16415 / MH) TaxID=1219045 RepID=A0A086P4E2_SPHHM|nr:hypothetical protein [Sphingobium herbicidovorans]KFG88260.1 hypothetical protein BV98_003843 [Sphingobium herbicidovorans NBRC 16415]